MYLRKLIDAFLNFPLRTKLILSFLVVIILGGILSLTLGTRLEHNTILSLAQAKVRHDLASAWMVYNEKLSDIGDIIRSNSSRESIQRALIHYEKEILAKYLGRVREDFNLDVLTLTDAKGKVVFRTSQPEIWGDDQSEDSLVRRALTGEIVSATQIIPRKELLKEGKSLAERAYLKFVPTP
ncbi:unnamed protein product, partial [marine sediment metagenome]